ncbi:hypothetical protein VUR80DRAFT_6779 [Thermomyces stellatus]
MSQERQQDDSTEDRGPAQCGEVAVDRAPDTRSSSHGGSVRDGANMPLRQGGQTGPDIGHRFRPILGIQWIYDFPWKGTLNIRSRTGTVALRDRSVRRRLATQPRAEETKQAEPDDAETTDRVATPRAGTGRAGLKERAMLRTQSSLCPTSPSMVGHGNVGPVLRGIWQRAWSLHPLPEPPGRHAGEMRESPTHVGIHCHKPWPR